MLAGSFYSSLVYSLCMIVTSIRVGLSINLRLAHFLRSYRVFSSQLPCPIAPLHKLWKERHFLISSFDFRFQDNCTLTNEWSRRSITCLLVVGRSPLGRKLAWRARLDHVSSACLAGWLAQTPIRTRDGALVSKVDDAFRVVSTRAGGLAWATYSLLPVEVTSRGPWTVKPVPKAEAQICLIKTGSLSCLQCTIVNRFCYGNFFSVVFTLCKIGVETEQKQ